MNNINENNKILNISFNQDNSRFSVSTEKGFKIYETYPLQREYENNIGSGLKFTEMYYNSNILVLVSGGENPKFSEKKIIIWDDSLNKIIGKKNFFKKIKNVKIKGEKIYIICENNIYIFNIKTLENIEIIETSENNKGLFSINSLENFDVIAFLAYIKNIDENNKNIKNVYIKIKNYEKSFELNIDTKEETVSYICLNNMGNLLAVANEKGNEIKIYSCLSGDLLRCLYRGMEKAEINYICFDKSSSYLAVTSDRGTIHIWSMRGIFQQLIDINKINGYDFFIDNNDKNDEDKIKNEIKDNNELPKNKALLFSNYEKSFARIKLQTNKSICAFHENNIIIAITYEGKYYQAKLDTKIGGHCQIIGDIDLKI